MRHPVHSIPVQNKLIQALALFLITAHPETDLLSRLLDTRSSLILALLTELPAELERIGELSPAQHAFRQHLNEMAGQVLSLIIENIERNTMIVPSIKCAVNWCAFKSFSTLAATSLIPWALSGLGEPAYVEASQELLLTWLESGVSDAQLISLLPAMTQYHHQLGPSAGYEDDSFKRVARIIFLYGELIADHFLHPRGVQLVFLERLAETTKMLGVSPAEEEDVESAATFWATFADMTVQSRVDSNTTILLALVEIFLQRIFQVPPPARPAIARFFIATHAALGDSLLAFLERALDEHQPPLQRAIVWTLVQLGETIPRENSILLRLIFRSPDLSLASSGGTFRLWRAFADVIKRERVLLERIALTTLAIIMRNEATLLPGALATLAALNCPAIYPLIVRHINLVPALTEDNRLRFWKIVCEAVGAGGGAGTGVDGDGDGDGGAGDCSNHSSNRSSNASSNSRGSENIVVAAADRQAMIAQLLHFLRPHVDAPSLFGIAALAALVPFAPLPSLRELLERCQISRFNLDDAQWLAPLGRLWVAVVEAHGPTQSTAVLELVMPSMATILSSLLPDLLAIPEAMVAVCPGAAGVLITSLSLALLTRDPDHLEEFSIALLPLYNKALLRTGADEEHAFSLLQRLLQKIASASTSDSFLRPALKTLALLAPGLEPQQQSLLFEGLLYSAQHAILPSQLELISPVLLDLLQRDPVGRGRLLHLLARSPTQQEAARKMVACRMPRLFARLLLQLLTRQSS